MSGLGRVWSWLGASWPALSAAGVGWTLWLAPRPLVWRRPVVDEFWRFAQLAGPGSLPTIVVAAVLVGGGLIGQSVFWLDRVGQTETLMRTLMLILIREVTPLVVGIVMLGRAGLVNLAELGRMRADGTVRALEAQGLDPLVLFVLPRVLALGLCTLVHAVFFLGLSIAAGYVLAQALGVTTQDPFALARSTGRFIGEVGVFVLPVKTLLIGFVIGGVTAATALHANVTSAGGDHLVRGFFRGLLALVVVSIIGSLVL